jgi:flagellar assembly protein FliH
MAIKKFGFGKSFDIDDVEAKPVAPVVEAPPEPPPEPTFKLSEVQEQVAAAVRDARQQGLEEGKIAGRAEAETAAARAMTEAIARVDVGLQNLLRAEQSSREERRQDTKRLALGIVQKMMPAWAARHGVAELETTLAQFLSELAGEASLTIRVHDSMAGPVGERIATIAARHGFTGQINLVGDPEAAPTDCFVTWADGGIERDTARLWGDINRIAGNLLEGATLTPTQVAPLVNPMPQPQAAQQMPYAMQQPQMYPQQMAHPQMAPPGMMQPQMMSPQMPQSPQMAMPGYPVTQ